MAMNRTARIVKRAREQRILVPAFNIPYLPMMRPVIRAVVDEAAFALIEVARLEWRKFESRSPAAVREEYRKWAEPDHVALHLDHIPVLDEDGQRVDYLGIIAKAIDLGYESVMVDGSRLPLQENIEATGRVAELAHRAGVPCEAELGAVLGHEAGPLPPYEELFASGRGFTDPDEAVRFVRDSGCDWLSVAIGNIHGRISKAVRNEKKVQARLDIGHLERLNRALRIPLVLHGGSGVRQDSILKAVGHGIAKMNIGTEIRQTYEQALAQSAEGAGGTSGAKRGAAREAAEEAVYEKTRWILREYLRVSGKGELLL